MFGPNWEFVWIAWRIKAAAIPNRKSKRVGINLDA
jgi:hypothetical protein